MCTVGRSEILSTIRDGTAELTAMGETIIREWQRSESIRKEIELDAFVIIPNHIHAIVRIVESSERKNKKGLEKHSLSSFIAGFKSSVTKQLRSEGLSAESPWQRGYYEHIIRDAEELQRIRIYIQNNPLRWEYDRDNMQVLKTRMNFVAG